MRLNDPSPGSAGQRRAHVALPALLVLTRAPPAQPGRAHARPPPPAAQPRLQRSSNGNSGVS